MKAKWVCHIHASSATGLSDVTASQLRMDNPTYTHVLTKNLNLKFLLMLWSIGKAFLV